jgi:hypothetical protein
MPFQTSGVSTDGQVRNQIISVMDLKKPEVRAELMMIYGSQGIPFIEQIRAMGYERAISANQTYTYEDTDNRQFVVISSTTQMPSAGNSYTGIFALSSSAYTPQPSYLPYNVYQSLFQYNQSSPYVAGQYAIPLQLNDALLFPENDAVGQVTSITGGGTNTVSITVVFPQGGQSNNYITTPLVSGDTIPYLVNSWSENSGQPNSRFWSLGKDTHYLQRIKATSSISGDQMTDQLWVQNASTGESLAGGLKKIGDMKTDWMFAKQISDALLFAPGGGPTSYLDPTTSKEPNSFTEGLIPYIKRRGLDLPYTAGTLSLSTIETESEAALQNYAVGDRMMWVGYLFDQEMSNLLRQANANTGVNFLTTADENATNNYLKGNRKLSMLVNWASFSFNATFRYYMSSLNELNFVDKYNTKHQHTALVVPMGTKQVQTSSTSMSQALPYMGIIYKAMDGYSRMTETWDISGAGGNTANYKSAIDARNLYFRSQIGGEHVGGNQMTYMHTN